MAIVWKHHPLSIHKNAPAAHAAAEAAHLQGRFWEMHDLIFGDQRQLTPDKFFDYAGQLGLDVERFKRDFVSLEVKERVDADSTEAQKLGATGTPAFFVNGHYLSGAKPFEEFKRLIDSELNGNGGG